MRGATMQVLALAMAVRLTFALPASQNKGEFSASTRGKSDDQSDNGPGGGPGKDRNGDTDVCSYSDSSPNPGPICSSENSGGESAAPNFPSGPSTLPLPLGVPSVVPYVIEHHNVTSHGPYNGPAPTVTGALSNNVQASAIPVLPPAEDAYDYPADGQLHDNQPAPYTPSGGVGTDGEAPVYRVQSDFDYQSLALALYQEWIELDLFHWGLATYSVEQFEREGLSSADRFLLQYMADQEVGHATVVANMLGPQAPKQCTYRYPVSNLREYVDFNQKLTRWGEAGVYGFLPHLDSGPAAQLLLQSITVEARQQMTFRQFGGQFPMPEWHMMGVPQSWAWTLLAPYISSCPYNQTRLVWQNFPALHILSQPNPSRINATAGFNETTGGWANTLSSQYLPSSDLCVNASSSECNPAITNNRSIPLSYPNCPVYLQWDAPGQAVGPNNSYITSTPVDTPRYAAWVSQLNVTYTPLNDVNQSNGTAWTSQPDVLTWVGNPMINGTMFLALTDVDLYVTPYNLTAINPHVAALAVAVTSVFAQAPKPGEDGKYTISSDGIRAQFIPYGASLTNLYVKDKNGEDVDVVLGYDDLDLYASDPAHPVYNAIPGRYANRIGNGMFTLDGETYELERNDGNNTLHSGTNNWSFREWNVTDVTDTSITFSIYDPEGASEGFPGDVYANVTYRVEGDTWHISMEATAPTKKTPLVLTQHTYFNLDAYKDPDTGLIWNHNLYAPYSSRYLEADQGAVPTGKILTAKPGSINDFASDATAKFGHSTSDPSFKGNCGADGACEGYNGFWLIEDAPEDAVVLTLSSEFSGIQAELKTDQPGVVIYSCSWMDGSIPLREDQGIEGRGFVERSSCVAIEAQDYPNGVNIPEWDRVDAQITGPDEVYTWESSWTFGLIGGDSDPEEEAEDGKKCRRGKVA
ncbi:related to Rds1 protein [Cephalotrichum gorgonifer]|uniref:Related to Rds1 protein n=1 Tax=Cephalotrichum gorgonifer TaxID=2041049 RepID=A0AAE8MVE4_9PEZI|nr:related to Rds1 protein [Cephalotrichum gorgonifer]